jgi:uncharacterized membrane protein SpoIIM required for sporulation
VPNSGSSRAAGLLRDSIRFIRENPVPLLLAVLAYGGGVVAGLVSGAGLRTGGEVSGEASGLDQLALFGTVVGANIKWQVTTIVVGGIVGLGVVAAGLLIYNGLVLGSAIRVTAQHGWALTLCSLGIHGVFEVVAIVLAGYVALSMPGLVMAYLQGDCGLAARDGRAFSLLKVCGIMATVTIMAAVLEAFFVPSVLRLTGWL